MPLKKESDNYLTEISIYEAKDEHYGGRDRRVHFKGDVIPINADIATIEKDLNGLILTDKIVKNLLSGQEQLYYNCIIKKI
jgi:hypothetical protein